MASMIVSKRLVEKLRVSALRPAAARSFSSLDINPRRSPDWGSDLFPIPFFSDVWDPFSVGTSLSQMMNKMEQMLEVSPSIRLGWDAWEDDKALHLMNKMEQMLEVSPSIRLGWDAWEDDKALHLTMEMPGLSKEDVKVWMEGNTLVIKDQEDEEEGGGGGGGGGEGEGEGGEAGRGGRMRRRYSARIELPSKGYKTAEIKAEVKNGVLKVVVPKATAEERGDVIHVQVQ